MTAGTGSRGAQARAVIADPGGARAAAQGQAFPCATVATLTALNSGYGKELAAYRSRFPEMSPVSGVFVAATDTFARGWMQVFSDVAKRYDVYILGSNNQAPFRESSDPADIEAFARPGPAAPVVGVRGDERRRLQRGLHVGPARRARERPRRCCATSSPRTRRCR